jgi:glycosyltransferase involved in cell wall biosynthesis
MAKPYFAQAETNRGGKVKEPIRVLIAVHQFFPCPPAGTEVLALEMARELQKLNTLPFFLAGKAHYDLKCTIRPWMEKDHFEGFEVWRLHYGAGDHRDPFTPHIQSVERKQLILNVVKETTPDLIHFMHLAGFPSDLLPELSAAGLPLIYTPTDYWVVCPRATLYRNRVKKNCVTPGIPAQCLQCYKPIPRWMGTIAAWLSQTPLRRVLPELRGLYTLKIRPRELVRCVNHCQRILPATRFLVDILVKQGVRPELIQHMPYGIQLGDLPDRIPIPKPASADNPLVLGFIGTLSEMKGIHILLKAVSLLGESAREFKVIIYGKIGEGDPFFKKLKKISFPIQDRVEFRGTFPHETIGARLREMHFLVVPSLWYESTPLVLCSALAAGIPAIVSRLGGLTEVIEEGRNGFSFEAGNAQTLTILLRRLLTEPQMVAKLKSEDVSRFPTTAEYARAVEREYKQVLISQSEVR